MKSFISWIGGKNYLKKTICDRMPAHFGRYIEVFGGAAWVLFHKDRHAEIEIYNDYNSDLVNLFRCVKFHCEELQRELSFMLNSRELFEDFKAQYNTRGLTDIQRAARFFIVLRISYGSNGRNYGCVKKDIQVMAQYLNSISKRLSKVVVENKDFEDLITVYDRPDALIYCDPPYYGTEKYYQAQFTHEDHVRLGQRLENIKGKFILSYNDHGYIRELYRNYHIEEVERLHNLVSRYDQDRSYKELLIRNY
ncbi:DNA adenine methylase [Pseudobacteroides cellulosolvens]|uniref:Site-specific DNA-methyltransferase (adenine-specific) n=1 Tax=Pseudobacteroides cellulosolvens ATCC 35603 = DSM 2933 TaxID=398512 RepID=A0A0L6JGN1_9FIRM|nr:Dam family site-specific DNA-(adenine-N6)-methyltransferase [Pseudobacteroides cellulosolvens]KNY24855.1 DNA adenine methylase [Pseudobacteroides cellulosolvens ATCC 35603 = DSM 2933]